MLQKIKEFEEGFNVRELFLDMKNSNALTKNVIISVLFNSKVIFYRLEI